MKDPTTGCPNHCPPACPDGDDICPGPKDAAGCEGAPVCGPMGICPVYCGPGEFKCTSTNGDELCMPMKDPTTGCPNHCPPACPDGDDICPGPKDAAGCEGAPVCGPMDICPVYCGPGEFNCTTTNGDGL